MSFRFLLRPKWLAWTLLVVVAVAAMLTAARWQWTRHNDRIDANALTAARTEQAVVPVEQVTRPSDTPDTAEGGEFRRVTATGTYDVEHQVLVANRSLDGLAGWWVVTPLVLADGTGVAVNRGFVPMDVTPDGPWDSFAPPSGTVTVTGLLQQSQARTAGPMDQARTLPRLNVSALDARTEADLAPLWLQLEQQDPPVAGALPRTLPEPQLDEGPHLSYTGQWLIFATLTVVVYVVLLLRVARRGDGDPTGRNEVIGGPPDSRSTRTDPGLLAGAAPAPPRGPAA